MEQTYNTTPVEKDGKPQFKTSEFKVENAQHLILCVINAPVGQVKIDAGMTLTTPDKTSSIPLNFIMLEGEPQQIIEQLLYGAGSILANGIKKNAKDTPKIIVPDKTIITSRS